MVKPAIFIPSQDNLSCLNQIKGRPSVLWPGLKPSRHEVIVLSDDDHAVSIRSNYGDIKFKFECFFLDIANREFERSREAHLEICKISHWDELRCLFRFEYERPAKLGEIPSTYIQVARKRGRMENISPDATAIGCALVGIVFWDSRAASPDVLIANADIDADDPASLEVCEDERTIQAYMDECEIVRLGDVSSWRRKVETWLASL